MSKEQSTEGQLFRPEAFEQLPGQMAFEQSGLLEFEASYWLYDRSGYKLSRASRTVRATSAETAVGFVHADVLGRGMTAEIISIQRWPR